MTKLQLNIRDNLIYFRISAKMSQGELADLAKVSRRMIQRLENGTANLTIETLMYLCDALKLDVKDILSSQTIMFKKSEASLKEIDWGAGERWGFAFRDVNNRVKEVSRSFPRLVDLCQVDLQSGNGLRHVIGITANTVKILSRSGPIVLAKQMFTAIGPDHERLGRFGYGYTIGSTICAKEIATHISSLKCRVSL